MANYDEKLLRSRRVDPSAPYPVLHQALRIALYDEYAARAYYAGVVAAFGPQPPFANIVQSEVQHIEALSKMCTRYGVPRPLEPFPTETTVSPSWRANLEQGIAAEIANVQLYQQLLAQVAEPDVRRVFRNLQAASLDNHLPAFRRALQSAVDRERLHAQQGIAPSQAYVRHGPVTNAVERGVALLARQRGAAGVAGSLLRTLHPSLVTGMVVGGTATYLLRRSKSVISPTKEN